MDNCCEPGYIYNHKLNKCLWNSSSKIRGNNASSKEKCEDNCKFFDMNTENLDGCSSWEKMDDGKARNIINYYVGCYESDNCLINLDPKLVPKSCPDKDPIPCEKVISESKMYHTPSKTRR